MLQLDAFARYLLGNSIIPEGHAPFYVRWVREFAERMPKDSTLTMEEKIGIFRRELEARHKEAWQVEQAERAIRLYLDYFRKLREWSAKEARLAPAEDGTVERAAALEAARMALRVKHYSYRTEQTYLDWLSRYFQYAEREGGTNGRARFDPETVKNFLAHLAILRRVSASTQNQAFSALLFFAQHVMKIELGDLTHTVRAKRGPRLPVVLSGSEVKALFGELGGTGRLMAKMIYGGGLRVMECCRLRVKDLDFDNRLVFVRGGKGDKDRSTLMPESAIGELREHLEWVRRLFETDRAAGVGPVFLPNALDVKYPKAGLEWGWQWVFPAAGLSVDPRANVTRRHHVSDGFIQHAIKEAVRKTDIAKPVSVHTLRHTFATQLLLGGVDIRQIQDYLGHARVDTTMIYTHVVRELRNPARSPMDEV